MVIKILVLILEGIRRGIGEMWGLIKSVII